LAPGASTLDCLCLQRVRQIRNLRAPFRSPLAQRHATWRRQVAGLDGRWSQPALERERKSTFLRGAGRHGDVGGSEGQRHCIPAGRPSASVQTWRVVPAGERRYVLGRQCGRGEVHFCRIALSECASAAYPLHGCIELDITSEEVTPGT